MSFFRTNHKKEKKKKLIRSIHKDNRKKIQTGEWKNWIVYPTILGNSKTAKMLKKLRLEVPGVFCPFFIPPVEDPLAYCIVHFDPIEKLKQHWVLKRYKGEIIVIAELTFSYTPWAIRWLAQSDTDSVYTLETKVDMEAVKACLRFECKKKYGREWGGNFDKRIHQQGDLYIQQLSKRPDRVRFTKDPKAKSTIRLKLKEMCSDESF